MSDRELMDLLNSIESSFPVAEWRVAGVGIWPLIRVRVRFRSFYSGGVTKRASSKWDRLAGFVRFNSVLRTSEVVFVGNGTYEFDEDRIAQPFLRRFESRMALWEPTYPHGRVNALWIRAGLDRATVLSSFNKIAEPEWWQSVQAAFAEHPELLPDWSFWSGHLARVLAYADFFQKRLRRTKLVLRTCWYDNVGMGLCLACRRLGIPCVDVQHGMVAPTHVGYAGWGSLESELLPTGFWLWADDRHLMRDWEGKASFIIGGNLALIDAQQSLDEWSAASEDEFPREPGFPEVLFCANGIMDESRRLRQALFALRALGEPFKLGIRRHPARLEEGKQLTLALGGEPEIYDAGFGSIGAHLHDTRLHLTSFSSTALDAEALGVPTVFLDPRGPELFPGLMERGMGFTLDQLRLAWNRGRQETKPPTYPEAWAQLEALIRHSD